MGFGYGYGFDTFQNRAESVDPAVRAFLTATGITNPTQVQAVEYLVYELKQNSLWAKFDAIYPFVGGTANTHKYNLKDPRDVNAAYRITWSASGVTHNSNGITGNGTTGAGYTNYVISAGRQNNMHLSVYVRNNVDTGCDIGAKQTDNSRFTHIFSRTSGQRTTRINSALATSIASTDSRGFFVGNRSGSSAEQLYKNGTSEATTANASTTPPTNQITLLARITSGTTVDNFSSHNLAFASIGASLTLAEQSIFYTIIQQFQTILSRQV